MIFMLMRRLRRGRNKRRAARANSKHHAKTTKLPMQTKSGMPEWEKVLTASLKQNALAPAEEIILHAFDLYCDELNRPFNERRRLLNKRFSHIAAGFARIQSIAPDMVERAAAKHSLELNRYINNGRKL